MINTNDLESITLQSGEKLTGRYLPDGTFDPVVFMIIPNLTNLQATASANFLKSELDEYKKLNNKLPDFVYYSNAVEIILYAIYEDIKNLVPNRDYSMAVVSGYNYDLPYRSVPIKKFLLKTDFKEFFTKHSIMIACYKSVLKNILTVGLSMTNEDIKEILKNSFYLTGELKGNKVHINKLGFDYNIGAFDQMDFFKFNLAKKLYDPDKFFGPAAIMQDDSTKLFEFITKIAL